MKYLVMIQARCGSTRLPNKVLKDLCGKPALQRMIERVQRSEQIDEIIVVTSIEKDNLPILRICADLGVRVGVGSENDVLDRFYQTAKLIKPKYVIRLTADCPCFDAELLDMAIAGLKEDTDYCAMADGEFADGLDLEIVRFIALEKAWREADHSFEREHVTQYIIRHPELFNLQFFNSPIGFFGDYRWTVDEPEDFEVVRLIYEHFMSSEIRDRFTYRDILAYVKDNPKLKALNMRYSRNEGLAKSIREDHIVKTAGLIE